MGTPPCPKNSVADPNPAFYLNADPDSGSQSNADPDLDPGQTLKSQKVEFSHEKYTYFKVV
jgi:hypothetical protein